MNPPTWRQWPVEETAVEMGGGFLEPIDLILPNFIEVPTGEREFDTFYIQVSVMDPVLDHGTRSQKPYTLDWIRANITTPDQLLDFLHQEVKFLLHTVVAHLDVNDGRNLQVATLFYASGQGLYSNHPSNIRTCGAVEWTGKLPL